MPFKSEAQRKLFYHRAKRSSKWRKMTKEWEAETPKDRKLPRRKKSKRKKSC